MLRMRWNIHKLKALANRWCESRRQRLMIMASETSPWWCFIYEWPKQIERWLQDFKAGHYCFSPMIQYQFADEIVQLWQYRDRLMVHLLYQLLKPTFKYIVSPWCLHLAGPTAIKQATRRIKAALSSHHYNYVIRLDIRSYYASIRHEILLSQLFEHFHDPIVRHYLQAIVTTGVDKNGQIVLPNQGIPRRSPLSPFLGAIYCTPLDRIFENRQGLFYLRYMDDVIILIRSQRQFMKVRKQVFATLRRLKLQISPRKTRMGRLKSGFHYLGVDFEVPRSPQNEIQVTTVKLHPRSCRRALDKVKAMREDAVHPAMIQRYLVRWATWWSSMIEWSKLTLLKEWVAYTEHHQPPQRWLGSGLFVGVPPSAARAY